MSSRLIVAGAGSGKTTWLIERAMEITSSRVLVMTFTDANEQSIRESFFEKNGCIPANVTVMTWFTFLLRHGVRPYQSVIYNGKITGIYLVNSKSGLKYRLKNGRPIYYGEDSPEFFYFNKDKKIFSDKIAKFVVKTNELTKGLVIDRISRIFPNILVDEVQDLSGYDLEIIKLFHKKKINLIMVGDPRQVTYHTHEEMKNKKYNSGAIALYLKDNCVGAAIDETSLNKSHRNHPLIIDFANRVYPNFPPCNACDSFTDTGHDGIYLISSKLIDKYIEKYNPVQLRDSRKVVVSEKASVMNFGDAKGLTFNRVLIYPTKPMISWIKNNSSNLEPRSRARFYVAITRAKYSVAFVDDSIDVSNYEYIKRWTDDDSCN